MKTLTPWGLGLWLLGIGRLVAADWTPWMPLGGEQIAGREGAVEIRVCRDESKDDSQKGYAFQYELRNASTTHVAKVSLAFPRLDPQSFTWENPDPKHATVIEVGPQAAPVGGSTYSPAPTALDHGALIEWLEEFTPKTEKEKAEEEEAQDREEEAQKTAAAEKEKAGDSSPAAPAVLRIERSGGTGGYTSSMVPEVVFRVPLDSKIISDEIIKNDEGAFPMDSQPRFRGVITIKRPAKWDKVSESMQAQWAENKVASIMLDEQFGNITNLRILAKSNTEIRYSFEGANDIHLLARLHNDNEWGTIPEEIVLVSYTPPPEPEPAPVEAVEKIVRGTTPPPKPAPEFKTTSAKVAAVKHSGYWFDPGDKDAKASDPVIYVRLGGQSRRVKLSEAKMAYGVPASAQLETMSHYSDREGKVLIDRKTHLP
jgi:hypothetical protein